MNLTGWLWDLRRSTSSPDYNSDAVDSIFLHDSMYSTLQQLNNHEASDTKFSSSNNTEASFFVMKSCTVFNASLASLLGAVVVAGSSLEFGERTSCVSASRVA
nr:uncharacterized protein LOC112801810 isoform X1 [Arachis hypogaea]